MDQDPNRTAANLTLWQGSCFLSNQPQQIGEINNMNKLKYIAAVLIGIAGLGLQQAKADTFDSVLNFGNSAISGFPAPYGTVHISLVGQTATITFTAANGYLFGDGSSVGVQVNASSFSEAIVTDAAFNQFSSGNVDGLGTFNLTIDNHDCFAQAVSTIVFTVTNTSGTPRLSAADVLAFNGLHFDAEGHIFIIADQTVLTGFAGENGAGVPDGGTTVMLLGMGLGVLGMARRFFLKS